MCPFGIAGYMALDKEPKAPIQPDLKFDWLDSGSGY